MEKLSAALNGSLASKMLIVGYDYDIFSQMKEPITVKDLAQKVECDERYLQEWCEGLHLSGRYHKNIRNACYGKNVPLFQWNFDSE